MRLIVALVVGLTAAPEVYAQEQAIDQRIVEARYCATIEDSLIRLTCFDRIFSAAAERSGDVDEGDLRLPGDGIDQGNEVWVIE